MWKIIEFGEFLNCHFSVSHLSENSHETMNFLFMDWLPWRHKQTKEPSTYI